MNFKLSLSKILIRFSSGLRIISEIIHSLPVALLKVDDLIELTNQYYIHPTRVKAWSHTKERGLYYFEEEFLKRYNLKNCKILAIGAGGGREAWGLARLGFDVVAMDVSEGIIAKSITNKKEAKNINIDFIVKDVYNLDFKTNSFDAVFFSGGSYSFIPSSQKRTEVLKKIKRVLKKKGTLLLSFMTDGNKYVNRFHPFFKLIAILTFGNKKIEKGDFIIGEGEFDHGFLNENEIIKEANIAGFFVDKVGFENDLGYKYAYLRPQ